MRTIERRTNGTEQRKELLEANPSHVVEHIFSKTYAPVFIATIISLITLLICGLFIYSVSEKLSAYERINAMRQSSLITERIIKVAAQGESSLQALRAAIIGSNPISEADFRAVSQNIVQRNPYIKLLSWAPSGQISRIYPLGLNKNLLSSKVDPTVVSDLKNSIEDFAVDIEGARQEQTALTMNSLLYKDDIALVDNGLLSLKIDLYHYLKESVAAEALQILPFVVKEQYSTSNVFEVGMLDISNKKMLESTFFYAGGVNWEIFTQIRVPKSTGLTLSWVFAVLLAIVLGFVSYRVFGTYQQRSVDAKAGVYRANFDLLTGLPNRYYFTRKLKESIEYAQREQIDFALFSIDIDHFKQMNDQLGNGVGDAVLTEFSSRLEFIANSNDAIGRVFGDEFILLARDVDDVIKADLLAERIKKIFQQPIEFADQQHFITLSVGIAMYPIDGEDAHTLLHHSDQAMHEAKRAGRNRHFFFNESMREQAETYLTIHQDLLRGLKAGEFELYYQPVLNVATQEIDFCEALLRWNHPERGLVMPDKFISVAERTGAIRDIGNWAFIKACRDIREFTDSDINIKISINHSISEYYSHRAFERWKSILSENFVTGDRFIFEIPEILLIDKKSLRMNVVTAMRKIGVQFAIDDFGTGHSSINYLRNYPADILKIDASLIQAMQQSSKDRTLVEVILKLAKSLGKVVVAEGVESKETAIILKDLQCDYIQGNWFIEPKPIDRLIPYIHQHMFEVEEQNEAVNH
jgi:diguanylate cyclase (GGDEF)-like protein